jgi:phage gpG-like protein
VRTYTPRDLAGHLASLPIAETIAAALESAAAGLADGVRETLSTPPSGPHDAPWVETGALRDSIAHSVDDTSAVVGSNDPAAAPQELGTARLPPRPFLAPAGAAQGEAIAYQIGAAVAALFSSDT